MVCIDDLALTGIRPASTEETSEPDPQKDEPAGWPMSPSVFEGEMGRWDVLVLCAAEGDEEEEEDEFDYFDDEDEEDDELDEEDEFEEDEFDDDDEEDEEEEDEDF